MPHKLMRDLDFDEKRKIFGLLSGLWKMSSKAKVHTPWYYSFKKYQKTFKILVSNEPEDSYFSHAAKLQSTNKKVSRMFY